MVYAHNGCVPDAPTGYRHFRRNKSTTTAGGVQKGGQAPIDVRGCLPFASVPANPARQRQIEERPSSSSRAKGEVRGGAFGGASTFRLEGWKGIGTTRKLHAFL